MPRDVAASLYLNARLPRSGTYLYPTSLLAELSLVEIVAVLCSALLLALSAVKCFAMPFIFPPHFVLLSLLLCSAFLNTAAAERAAEQQQQYSTAESALQQCGSMK